MKLVSVITPTWNRHEAALNRCAPSVRQQTYSNVEHVIVSDGPDPELRELVDGVIYDELPTHPKESGWGTEARLRGLQLASGDYIAHLDDDNAFRPMHLELMVAALESSGADFAYGLAEFHMADGGTFLLGRPTPVFCHIDTSMLVHRRELLDKATWRYREGQQTNDWDLVERWMAAGAKWEFVPVTTVDYYFPGAS